MSRRRVTRRVQQASVKTERLAVKADGEWYYRPLRGSSSSKTYTCPDCLRPIVPATPHVVAWPVEKALLSAEAIDERRHWHTSCWNRKL